MNNCKPTVVPPCILILIFKICIVDFEQLSGFLLPPWASFLSNCWLSSFSSENNNCLCKKWPNL